jgi:hypothetical protein
MRVGRCSELRNPSPKSVDRADRLRQTIIWTAYRNAGMRRGIRGVTFLVSWGLCADSLDRVPSVDDVGEYWGDSRATAYRDFGDFRAAFPEEATPERLWAVVRAHVSSRERGEAFAEACSVVLR